MALIPKDATGRLAYFTTHAPIWLERAAEIGLDEEQAQAVLEAVEAAKAAQLAANMAAEAAKSATLRWNFADELMTRLGAGALRSIKACAAGQPTPTDESAVYTAAQVDRPNRPGPKRRDQAERNNAVPRVNTINATPDSFGNVRLRWTAVRGATMGAGAGMAYEIARAIDGGPEALIGVVGGPGAGRTSNTFTDEHVPHGARNIFYRVTPMQGGGVGTSSSATVRFGSSGVGVGARAA